MQGPQITESHYITNKMETPVKYSCIGLSPKKKSRQRLETDYSQVETIHYNSSFPHFSKENHHSNFEVVDMPVLTERAFEKIPLFHREQIIVKSKTCFGLESQGKGSKKKKILITALENHYRPSASTYPYTSKFEDSVANEEI